MLAICPECNVSHNIDSSGRMMGHNNKQGSACLGIGAEARVTISAKTKSPRFRSVKNAEDLDIPSPSVPIEATQTFVVADKKTPSLSFSFGDLLKSSKKKR